MLFMIHSYVLLYMTKRYASLDAALLLLDEGLQSLFSQTQSKRCVPLSPSPRVLVTLLSV